MARRIYLASSWRNSYQPEVVKALREWGHEVYDFRNPTEGDHGFSWREIGDGFEHWTAWEFREALKTPIAARGFSYDKDGCEWADTGVLLLPCGRSAHLEAGYLIGQGKPTLVLALEERTEPELMYLLAARICLGMEELKSQLWHLDHSGAAA
jgi:hypothetical protein